MKPSVLTLLDSDDLEASEFDSILQAEGFAHQLITLQENSTPSLLRTPFAVTLVFSQFDPLRIDKAMRKLSDYMRASGGQPEHIIACGPELIPKDENVLRGLGANKVTQPASLEQQKSLDKPKIWKARAAAQRVLAALYGGFVTVQNGQETKTYVEFEKDEKLYLECRVPYEAATEIRKMIGATQIMRALFTRIKAYSHSPDPVLIRGETGTGKELAAAAIANEPEKYKTINIAELPSELVASELFGHRRGSFTDAYEDTKGLLIEAGDGTVLIDEIGDLDSHNQALLLRVLANRQIRPIGTKKEKIYPLKARLIFATNRSLEAMCFRGEFRRDLYQRIREGHRIELPLLSERRGDLELLTKEFFNKWYEDRSGLYEDTFTLSQSDYDKIVDLCIQHEFSGNIRGLRGILRSCFSESLFIDRRFNLDRLKDEIGIDRKQAEAAKQRSDDSSADSRLPSVTFDPTKENYRAFKKRAITKYFTEVYKATGKNLERTLEMIKVSKKTFYHYLPEEEHVRNKGRVGSEADSEVNDDNGEET
jgi:DNA-binding NtrC family response regulator